MGMSGSSWRYVCWVAFAVARFSCFVFAALFCVKSGCEAINVSLGMAFGTCMDLTSNLKIQYVRQKYTVCQILRIS